METKFKNEYRKKVINMITKLLEEHPISEEFTKVTSENEFFEDCVNFVDLRYQLSEIKSALKIAMKYSDC